jgi:hypothetical protein
MKEPPVAPGGLSVNDALPFTNRYGSTQGNRTSFRKLFSRHRLL